MLAVNDKEFYKKRSNYSMNVHRFQSTPNMLTRKRLNCTNLDSFSVFSDISDAAFRKKSGTLTKVLT